MQCCTMYIQQDSTIGNIQNWWGNFFLFFFSSARDERHCTPLDRISSHHSSRANIPQFGRESSGTQLRSGTWILYLRMWLAPTHAHSKRFKSVDELWIIRDDYRRDARQCWARCSAWQMLKIGVLLWRTRSCLSGSTCDGISLRSGASEWRWEFEVISDAQHGNARHWNSLSRYARQQATSVRIFSFWGVWSRCLQRDLVKSLSINTLNQFPTQ